MSSPEYGGSFRPARRGECWWGCSGVADDIGAVGERQVGITRAIEFPSANFQPKALRAAGWDTKISGCGGHRLRDEAEVGQDTGNDPEIREVDPLQELGKFLLDGDLGGYTKIRWHEFDACSFSSLSKDFLLVTGTSYDRADHNADTRKGCNDAGLVGIISPSELGTSGERFRFSRLDGSSQGADQEGRVFLFFFFFATFVRPIAGKDENKG